MKHRRRRDYLRDLPKFVDVCMTTDSPIFAALTSRGFTPELDENLATIRAIPAATYREVVRGARA